MYFKKQGNVHPVIKAGCIYGESYFYEGHLFLKYNKNNVPSEDLIQVSQAEYETNKPVIPEPESNEPQPTGLEILMQAQADAELRDFAIQQGQELLAQQMADIELAVLGGAV